jgi:hypothetical protein
VAHRTPSSKSRGYFYPIFNLHRGGKAMGCRAGRRTVKKKPAVHSLIKHAQRELPKVMVAVMEAAVNDDIVRGPIDE